MNLSVTYLIVIVDSRSTHRTQIMLLCKVTADNFITACCDVAVANVNFWLTVSQSCDKDLVDCRLHTEKIHWILLQMRRGCRFPAYRGADIAASSLA